MQHDFFGPLLAFINRCCTLSSRSMQFDEDEFSFLGAITNSSGFTDTLIDLDKLEEFFQQPQPICEPIEINDMDFQVDAINFEDPPPSPGVPVDFLKLPTPEQDLIGVEEYPTIPSQPETPKSTKQVPDFSASLVPNPEFQCSTERARFSSPASVPRRRSISKMPLSQLYQVMGLSHNHGEALEREERIMLLLERHGFEVGEKTWIRDTEESQRRAILDSIYTETFKNYGYSKRLLEAIIRRGTYARMQSNLRRRRRHRHRLQNRY